MSESGMTIFYWVLGATVLILFIRMFFSPLRIAAKALLRTGAGLFCVAAVNLLGGFFNVTLGLNLINGAVIGFLGVPGLVLLLLSQWLLI